MADTKSRPATIPFLSPATISPSCAARSRCSSTVQLPGLHSGTGMDWQLASGSTTGTASAFTQFMGVRGATIRVTGVFTQKRFYTRSPYAVLLALPPGFVVWSALHILPCLFIYIYTQIQTVIVTKPLYSHYIPIKIKSDSIPMIGWWYEVILSNKLKGYNVYSQFYSDPLW